MKRMRILLTLACFLGASVWGCASPQARENDAVGPYMKEQGLSKSACDASLRAFSSNMILPTQILAQACSRGFAPQHEGWVVEADGATNVVYRDFRWNYHIILGESDQHVSLATYAPFTRNLSFHQTVPCFYGRYFSYIENKRSQLTWRQVYLPSGAPYKSRSLTQPPAEWSTTCTPLAKGEEDARVIDMSRIPMPKGPWLKNFDTPMPYDVWPKHWPNAHQQPAVVLSNGYLFVTDEPAVYHWNTRTDTVKKVMDGYIYAPKAGPKGCRVLYNYRQSLPNKKGTAPLASALLVSDFCAGN